MLLANLTHWPEGTVNKAPLRKCENWKKNKRKEKEETINKPLLKWGKGVHFLMRETNKGFCC